MAIIVIYTHVINLISQQKNSCDLWIIFHEFNAFSEKIHNVGDKVA